VKRGMNESSSCKIVNHRKSFIYFFAVPGA
jgi:hypothetical protein